MLQHLRCCILSFLFMMYCMVASSQTSATLVKDIGPEWQSGEPAFLTVYNNELYFRANDYTHGRELWKTDGTTAGTVMVKDIYPGSNGSDPEWLTVANGILFFSANDGSNGAELWRSDGTEAGTYMVRNISPGNDNTYPAHMVEANGLLYFTIGMDNPVVANRGLWKSDGTEAGTVKVAGTYSNEIGFGYVRPTNLVNVNGTLFFIGEWPSLPVQRTLWKSDGTEAGTVMVSTNVSRFPYGIGPSYLTPFNNEVYFAAKIDDEGGAGLWKSDGTDAGTVMVKDMDMSGVNGGVQHLTNINNTLYFGGFSGGSNDELWKSDGTEAGTVFVKDINPGTFGSQPSSFVSHNGQVYFVANTAAYGGEIWKTDGTEAGTSLVADLYEGASSTFVYVPGDKAIISLNNALYLVGYLDNDLSQELYKLNETTLPIVWEDIGIGCKENLPHLYWKTASEINTKDFIVQASSDAVDWINRETIAAAGNSNTSVGYQYSEHNIRGNYQYYRIMQRDLDGKSIYSKVLNINCGSPATRLNIFPNPANHTITLTGIESRDISYIEIFDITGRNVLLSQDKKATVDISILSKGWYILKLVKKDAAIMSRKFIKR